METQLKAHFPPIPQGEAAVNNQYIARRGKGESGEEKLPVLSLTCFLSLLPAYATSCITTWSCYAPLYVSISFSFLPSQSRFFYSCVPGRRLLKGRWNWMPPSQSFPLRLVGDFVLLAWLAYWLIIIQNINCLSCSAMALKSAKHSGQQTSFYDPTQYIYLWCKHTMIHLWYAIL